MFLHHFLIAIENSHAFPPFLAPWFVTICRKLIPVDPSEIDRCVTLVLNPVTKEYEAVVVAAVEPSFEWVHSSPVDLHTFDVTPVVRLPFIIDSCLEFVHRSTFH